MFPSPCDRCYKVRYLDQKTSLCLSEKPKRVEWDSCFEGVRLMDDVKKAA